jgi:hypothetical protein
MNGAYHRHYLPFFLAWLLKITILDRFLHERAKQWQKEVPAVYSFFPPSFFHFLLIILYGVQRRQEGLLQMR